MAITPATSSAYLRYLPAIYTDDPFVGRFLLAFEAIFTGVDADDDTLPESLEHIIGTLAARFDPERAPEEFLPWLASWAALTLETGWSAVQQRDFLSQVIPLYRRRGTRDNLRELLRIYTGSIPVIDEDATDGFQIGVHSTLGADAQIGGGLPHYFHVTVAVAAPDLDRVRRAITALVDMEKPAHTYYTLTLHVDTMQIGVRSTIGVDTLLGNLPAPS
jgi:phage tail-like protein